jgi:hypothetical protein
MSCNENDDEILNDELIETRTKNKNSINLETQNIILCIIIKMLHQLNVIYADALL